MARNGSGGYTLPSNSWNPAVNGVSATAVDWQSLINDVAQAIQQSISADGQTPITGNLQMGGNKLTGLAAGSGTGQSLRFEQLFSQGPIADIASAATVDIGAQLTCFLNVVGTTTITSFGVNYNGPRYLKFAGILTLTNSASLVLPTGANITTEVGDSLIAIPLASGWQVVAYQRASGQPLASTVLVPATTSGTSTAYTITPTPAISAYAANLSYWVTFHVASGASPTLQISGVATPPALVRYNSEGALVAIGATEIPTGFVTRVTLISATQALVEEMPPVANSTTFRNLVASANGTSATVTVTADEVSVSSATNFYKTLRSVSLSISGAGSGANGLDTGTIAASTWYSVWVISNGTTTAGLLSLSATSPTMPSGYTFKSRIGWIRTDGTANKYPLKFKQVGNKVQYVVGNNVPNAPLMASGTAGSVVTPTYVAIPVANYVPTTAGAISVFMGSGNTAQNSICAPNQNYGDYSSATNAPPLNISTSATCSNALFVLESSSIYWASGNSQAFVACLGWEDNL